MPQLVSYLPVDTVAFARVNWREVRGDSVLKRIVNGDDIEKVIARLQLKSQDVDGLALFSGSPSPSGLVSGLLISSAINVRSAEKIGTFRRTETLYHGVALYDETGGSFLALLTPKVLVVGNRVAIQHVIDARQDRATSLLSRTDLKSLIDRSARTDAPIAILLAMPVGAAGVADFGLSVAAGLIGGVTFRPMALLLEKIGIARAVSFSISRRGKTFPVDCHASMRDEQGAAMLATALKLLKGLAHAVPDGYLAASASNGTAAFRSLEIEQAGAIVSLRLAVADRDLGF